MKKILIVLILAYILGLCGVLLSFQSGTKPGPDAVAINDTVVTALQSGDQAAITEILTHHLQQEYDRMDVLIKNRDTSLIVLLSVYIGIVTAAGLGLYIYCHRSILAPFRKLQRFARDVAAGNLDIPLEMDRHGRFGAFTESFDLMREELKKSKENERNADRSKKELVASISHDVKTPVASIKAAAELLLLSAKDEKEKTQLERIEAKAEQINALITDMFHATLEELQALSVTTAEIHSTVIPGLIESADYKGLVQPFSIPDCIVTADVVRLQQIFDNLIGNSYKYADTAIEVRVAFDGQYLVIGLLDSGPGVQDNELPLLTGKFYRGKNASDRSGYGLGLYISRYLLAQMSGDLRCENHSGGFAVSVILKLAGS